MSTQTTDGRRGPGLTLRNDLQRIWDQEDRNMQAQTSSAFRCEVEQLPDDALGNKVTTVRCHGRLLSENNRGIKDVVKPLLPLGGRIVIDLTHVEYVDSAGLGALVGLKVSALHQGLCILELVNMGPRILDLLRIAGLQKMFSSVER